MSRSGEDRAGREDDDRTAGREEVPRQISAIGTEDVALDEVSVQQKEILHYKEIQRIRQDYERKPRTINWVAVTIRVGLLVVLPLLAAIELRKS